MNSCHLNASIKCMKGWGRPTNVPGGDLFVSVTEWEGIINVALNVRTIRDALLPIWCVNRDGEISIRMTRASKNQGVITTYASYYFA